MAICNNPDMILAAMPVRWSEPRTGDMREMVDTLAEHGQIKPTAYEFLSEQLLNKQFIMERIRESFGVPAYMLGRPEPRIRFDGNIGIAYGASLLTTDTNHA